MAHVQRGIAAGRETLAFVKGMQYFHVKYFAFFTKVDGRKDCTDQCRHAATTHGGGGSLTDGRNAPRHKATFRVAFMGATRMTDDYT